MPTSNARSTNPSPSRGGGPSILRTLTTHWQVVVALVLLVVGATGLMVSNYGKSECSAMNSSPIPDHLANDLQKASETSGFPVRVLAAQIEAESGWDPDAHSHAGAMGIAQFTQDTWDVWGEGDPMNEKDAIAAQGRYMKYLHGEADNYSSSEEDSTRFALAGYNAGPNAMKKAKGVPEISETQHYVDKIMKLSQGKYSQTC
ncbi:lytic transglycosylase domain-containing protein [Kocuria massiliensis]|uniref:transglycosylase SLT domain-containing protein n=1 Tax=Kocuria massiliensis TaxID=1926282 RepID=UPI0022B96CA8|nr:lytic transglycosylase domain-containing protein [Kocuria massiliensis]